MELCQERIRELLNRSGGVAAELFAAARTGAEVPGGSRSSVQWVNHSAALSLVWRIMIIIMIIMNHHPSLWHFLTLSIYYAAWMLFFSVV